MSLSIWRYFTNVLSKEEVAVAGQSLAKFVPFTEKTVLVRVERLILDIVKLTLKRTQDIDFLIPIAPYLLAQSADSRNASE